MATGYVRSLGLRAMRPRVYLEHFDPWLLVALLAVVVFGMTILYRDQDVLVAQAVRIAAGILVMVLAAQVDPRVYLRWTPVVYFGGLVLLVATLFLGVTVNGSTRWLEAPGGLRFQPSELMKIAIPMMLGWYFHRGRLPPRFGQVAVALLIIGAPALLIVRQPDLGTAVLLSAGGLGVIVLAGIRWRWIFVALGLAAAAAPGLWMLMREYQRDRVRTLFDPEHDPTGAGWNIIQSKTAVGSGGVFGKGLDQGTQSRLDFLPESHTDFIVAVIGEELGLVGVTLLIVLYLAILARGLFIATQASTPFARLLVGGLMLTFFVYVFVNIAMVCGLFPVVGVPLPLVSFGGTSAVSLLAGFGIVMSVRTHRNW